MNINEDNQLTGAVIGAAIEVHRQLGPLLDESAYEEALAQRLTTQDVACRRQVPLPLTYKGVRLDCGYRLDLLVEERLPVELKAVATLLPVHDRAPKRDRPIPFPLLTLSAFHTPTD